MIEKEIKFDWDDVLLMPTESTLIQSRFKDINLEYNPLFTAPMDTVVDFSNYSQFRDLGVNICFPRGVENLHDYSGDPNIFRSMSLKEFDETYNERKVSPMFNICIDTANGHISTLPPAIVKFKSLHGEKFKLMVGNIANPKTLEVLDKAGADYCRVGIGNGSGCWIDGVIVNTSEGHFLIEDVCVGDKVLTHLGNYREVIAKSRFKSFSNMLEINGMICTEDHEVFVIHTKDRERVNEVNYLDFAFWIEAQDLDEDNHLVVEMDMEMDINA